jgi:hypothetical protein
VTRAQLIAAAFVLTGCAHVADPLPPSLKIPEAITDLRAIQRGSRIYVAYSEPAQSTDGLPLTPERSVVRVFAAGAEGRETTAEFDATPYAGQEIRIDAISRGPKGRWSAPSNTVRLRVVAALPVPGSVRATAAAEGVEISWTGPGPVFRIFRDGAFLADSPSSPFLDRTTSYGREYRYVVQALSGATESDPAPEVAITPRDTFPPPVPAGLTALAGISAIELGWEASPATDFSHFRLFRDGVEIEARVTATSYSDRGARPGVTHRYQISAVDHLGNASPLSAPSEARLP